MSRPCVAWSLLFLGGWYRQPAHGQAPSWAGTEGASRLDGGDPPRGAAADGSQRCPYLHPVACAAEPMQHFLSMWRKKLSCWLCSNEAIVNASNVLIRELVLMEPLGDAWRLTAPWFETCLSAHLLALFASTRSAVVQTWRFYELGLQIVRDCDFDDSKFFSHFGITTTQIAYVFYIIGYSYHLPWNVLQLQAAEGGYLAPQVDGGVQRRGGSLVLDIGMGLGADTRYYLAQGFRVVAVEANQLSIEAAMAVQWVRPFLASGQLAFLHAAIAPPGAGGSTTTLFAVQYRPEQSDGRDWIEHMGGERMTVRTVECADLLRVFGQAIYMKIDVESNSADCLASLRQANAPRREEGPSPAGAQPTLPLPRYLSLELETVDLGHEYQGWLSELGYVAYKMCRQYIYSPAPCEQGSYTGEVPGCGSGPFGSKAVDYLRGTEWHNLSLMPQDTTWEQQYTDGIDWFDLHAVLGE